jgi:photosystem II stability/assembly factor-like uncharacterized protein
VICKTTDGGNNWTASSYNQGGTLVSLYFKNQSTGIIGGYLSSHLAGFIIKTTNSGSNWSRLNFNGEPYDIFSFGGDTVWSSRHDGYVMRTYNLGDSWTSTFVHQNLELYTVYFINNQTGWTEALFTRVSLIFIKQPMAESVGLISLFIQVIIFIVFTLSMSKLVLHQH